MFKHMHFDAPVGRVLLANSDFSPEQPGLDLERKQGFIQTKIMRESSFSADAGPFAAFELIGKAGTSAFLESKAFEAQQVFCCKSAQHLRGVALGLEQAIKVVQTARIDILPAYQADDARRFRIGNEPKRP